MKYVTINQFLSVVLILVLAALTIVFAQTNNQKPQTSKASEITTPTPEHVTVSDFFETKEKDKPVIVTNENRPSDLKADEACIINGEVVKEGTVSSNTICINEVTPTSSR
jgi:hypothetical protein